MSRPSYSATSAKPIAHHGKVRPAQRKFLGYGSSKKVERGCERSRTRICSRMSIFSFALKHSTSSTGRSLRLQIPRLVTTQLASSRRRSMLPRELQVALKLLFEICRAGYLPRGGNCLNASRGRCRSCFVKLRQGSRTMANLGV
jgi:hypothetical protein